MIKILVGFICCILLAGCVAQSSQQIMPEYIPPSNYAGMSCEDTTALLAYKQDEEAAVSAGQDARGSGILGIVSELNKMSNDEREKTIARLKGEVNALKGAVMANC